MPALFGLVVVLGIYGWFRVHRGVDFTDEGFYVTSPLRLIFGERLFSSELMTLQKPFELILYPLFRLHPSVTLVEIRLAGWALHLLAYAVLATALYLYSASILISLAASTFVFFVGFDGIVTPGYNLLSRDFLIISLSLRLLATFLPARREVFVHGLSGIALFLGIVSYPTLFGLFVPLAVADAVQCYRRRTGRPATPWLRCCDAGNSITTAVLGVIFLFVLWTTGALRDWIQRFPMTTSFGLTSLQNSPVQTSGAIVGFLFDQSLFAEKLFGRSGGSPRADPGGGPIFVGRDGEAADHMPCDDHCAGVADRTPPRHFPFLSPFLLDRHPCMQCDPPGFEVQRRTSGIAVSGGTDPWVFGRHRDLYLVNLLFQPNGILDPWLAGFAGRLRCISDSAGGFCPGQETCVDPGGGCLSGWGNTAVGVG